MSKKNNHSRKNNSSGRRFIIAALALAVLLVLGQRELLSGRSDAGGSIGDHADGKPGHDAALSIEDLPDYSGEGYIEINDNVPSFTEEEMTTDSYEKYSELDSLGRCGPAEACVGKDLMPTGERNQISSIHPSGWNTAHYDFVDQGMLFNRCHLIAYQLTGEDLNERNLITGTRTLNAYVMLPFEEQVGNWVRRTGNHVMYRVTPVFYGRELVARGVQMEAKSVEDDGKAISYNVFIYNVEPGVEIDYRTGNNWLADKDSIYAKGKDGGGQGDGSSDKANPGEKITYVLNTNSKKFHSIDCKNIADIAEHNKETVRSTRQALIDEGYEPCGYCRP